MDNDSIAKVDELVERLSDKIPVWKIRDAGNDIMQAILEKIGEPYIDTFCVALSSVLKKHNLCHTHDCFCEDCPNSRFNYFAETDENHVEVEPKEEIKTESFSASAEVEDKWRDAALKVFKKYNSWYGAMSLPSLTSEVLTSLNAQPSNYSKMDSFFKSYLRSPNGTEHFVVTKGRGGGVRLVAPYRQDYEKYK